MTRLSFSEIEEARLARVIRQHVAKRALELEEREKGEVDEPDEEYWEELRQYGQEARHLSWNAIKYLDGL